MATLQVQQGEDEDALGEAKVTTMDSHFTASPKNANINAQVPMETPRRQQTTAVRRSARITNRAGPCETTERYTLAAEIKSLEKLPMPRKITLIMDSSETISESIKELNEVEAWETVAEGAGYTISPSKKESVGTFIKGARGPMA